MVMRIRELRESRGLLQAQLAAGMGTTQSAISNWESEVALPKSRELPRLAKLLGCSIEELFTQEGE